MGDVNFAGIADALATIFEEQITSQINRSTVLMQLLSTGPGEGKQLNWNARFGSAVGGSRAEGADVAAFNNDDKIPATLLYGTYDDSFAMTGKAISAALNAGNPQELEDLFQDEMGDCIERLAKGINQDIWTGAGGTDQIMGLYGVGGPLDTTGIYAGIDRATYAQWASNELANGGVPRALTFALMRQALDDIYTASGEATDLIATTPALYTKFGNLFGNDRRFNTEVTIRGKRITLSGGFNALEFDGIPVVRDVDCPAGTMAFLSTRTIKVCQMPDAVTAVNESKGTHQLAGSPEMDMGAGQMGLTARLNPLARTGDKYKFQAILYPQLKVRRCNAQASIIDLDATL